MWFYQNNFISLVSNFENTHWGLSVLGLKIKINKRNKVELQQEKTIVNQWTTQFDNSFNNFMQQYILANRDTLSCRLSLIAISILLENSSYSQAEYLIDKHVKKFGLQDIPKFLLVSEYCNNLGFSDVEIKKSAVIYQYIKKNQNNNILNNFIAHKNIAVVGNSPCIIGKQLGNEIDNNDIVIKFNNFSNSLEYQYDFGTKNDVWMIAGNITKRNYDTHFESLKMIIIADDIEHCVFKDDFRNFLYEIIVNNEIPITSFSFEYRKELRSRYNLIHPSTGFQMINYLNNNKNLIKSLNIYGFSANDNKEGLRKNMFNKYFQERKPFYIVHNYYKEAEIISEIMQPKRSQYK